MEEGSGGNDVMSGPPSERGGTGIGPRGSRSKSTTVAPIRPVFASGGVAEGQRGSGDRLVDLGLAVRERDERGLELRRREVDAAREHRVEEAGEALRVGPLRGRVVRHGSRAEE